MHIKDPSEYFEVRSGKPAYYRQDRGLIAVWGKEAIQFLDGLISNDMKTLADGVQMLAAFPNAQGRLLAVVRVLRQGDRFYFETEQATKDKLYASLFRFTYAGDFFVEDLSEQYRYFEIFGTERGSPELGYTFALNGSIGNFVPIAKADSFLDELKTGSIMISDALYEILRIENGTPFYGVDMDETTIVPELGLDGLISYKKGCYIGQEIIARIHFRGHVAKQLMGLTIDSDSGDVAALRGTELFTAEGKNAGRITSAAMSPKLNKTIALGYLRYEHLQPGTTLKAGSSDAEVSALPFIA